MLRADRDQSVKEYACQAVEFVWPLDAPHVSHVVDLVCWRLDGSVLLVDSHPADDDEFRSQVDLTRAVCDLIGWHYEVFTGLGHHEEVKSPVVV